MGDAPLYIKGACCLLLSDSSPSPPTEGLKLLYTNCTSSDLCARSSAMPTLFSLIPLLESVLICASTWFLWKYFRHLVVKSPLDNIPGPPSPSFWTGKVFFFFDPQ